MPKIYGRGREYLEYLRTFEMSSKISGHQQAGIEVEDRMVFKKEENKYSLTSMRASRAHSGINGLIDLKVLNSKESRW